MISHISKNKKQKYFINFVIGYFPALHAFAKFQNYYLYPSLIAVEQGYRSVIITKEGMGHLRNDPSLGDDIQVIEYKNIFQFTFLLVKYSCLGSVFYINNHNLISYYALILTKVFFSNNIFMGHIQPKRTNHLRQLVFNGVLLFTSRIRLNNQNEKDFLLSQGIAEKKLYVSPIAINSKVFTFINTNYSDRRDILYYGNTTTQKGIPTILKAFKIVLSVSPKTKLHIVGSQGNYDPKEDIRDLGLEGAVIEHGAFMHGSKLNEALNSTLIFALSTKAEGQCMAVYEAALAGNALCLPNIMSFEGIFKNMALFHNLGDEKKLADNILKYLTDLPRLEKDNMGVRQMIGSEYAKQIAQKKLVKLLSF